MDKKYISLTYDLMLKEEYLDLPHEEGDVPEKDPKFTTYFPDGFHPTQEVYNIMCDVIIDEMDSHYHLF